MSLLVLIALASIIGAYIGKNPDEFDPLVPQGIKWLVVLSSFFWLGAGVTGIIAVFLLYQAFYMVSRNISAGKDAWFIDNDTWLGDIVIKYTGNIGGKILFGLEVLAAVLLLII